RHRRPGVDEREVSVNADKPRTVRETGAVRGQEPGKSGSHPSKSVKSGSKRAQTGHEPVISWERGRPGRNPAGGTPALPGNQVRGQDARTREWQSGRQRGNLSPIGDPPMAIRVTPAAPQLPAVTEHAFICVNRGMREKVAI